ncbi:MULTISPECIES: nucleotidyltransferase family protein [unclassified Okeania]|uniref:nucleotidyltransferase family protein n=1 Tax=unclassified Okeania TaxID=2634635 RepID=UPI0013B98A16|nr:MULTISPECIES: nucleotidyltransferase family protein [unclassified Okeania]NET11818.1 nucleotidyltransferase family protein [Okeania sp. SIO1H6]NEP72052.1 nucleotidyltransferase family protein [Okeania sp. SIO2G5]NEP92908.1 nucleotidyltransferase family protein [Okeania sp. SIO2F5]NEQ94105.1 nucleotidyltransferase family protein [Okeania sp. SIO2G4]NES76789.1 nucleotidyltransferase family protein [Okeania sp. SIO1H4]
MNLNLKFQPCSLTHEQKLLLRVCLFQGEDVLKAWQQWVTTVDIDNLDSDSNSLLPLVYRNLSTHQINHPEMGRLKGIYRSKFYKNQLLIQKITKILNSLQDADIETILLNDVAINLQYYPHIALRHIYNFDLLIRTENASKTINFLDRLGWKYSENLPIRTVVGNAAIFKDELGCRLSIHYPVALDAIQQNVEHNFWQEAEINQVGEMSTYLLNPSNQLLQVCLQAWPFKQVSTAIWVADAMMILNSSGDKIDWNQLINQAKKRQIVLPVQNTLPLLDKILDTSLPEATLQEIEQLPISKLEQREYQIINSKLYPFIDTFLSRYYLYSRLVNNSNAQLKLIEFTRYLQAVWGLASFWQVPIQVVIKAIRKAKPDIFKI